MRILIHGREGTLSSEMLRALRAEDEIVIGTEKVDHRTDVVAVSDDSSKDIFSIWKNLDPSVSLLMASSHLLPFVKHLGSGNIFHIPLIHTNFDVKNALEAIRRQRVLENSLKSYFVGKSRIMKRLRSQIAFSSLSSLPVHLYGETGTGKTFSSRLIHTISGNRKKLVYVNCSNLNSNLGDSDLFGHTKGAFTSSCSERKGLLGLADDSTLFLDEVGDLPLDLQGKLLDAIENGTYRKIGSDTEDRSSFRLITAAHRSLEELVEDKKLRKDFYYRIKNISIYFPPLKDHLEDIPDLIKDYEEKNSITDIRLKDWNPLMEYGWEGNVRELLHFLDRVYNNKRL